MQRISSAGSSTIGHFAAAGAGLEKNRWYQAYNDCKRVMVNVVSYVEYVLWV